MMFLWKHMIEFNFTLEITSFKCLCQRRTCCCMPYINQYCVLELHWWWYIPRTERGMWHLVYHAVPSMLFRSKAKTSATHPGSPLTYHDLLCVSELSIACASKFLCKWNCFMVVDAESWALPSHNRAAHVARSTSMQCLRCCSGQSQNLVQPIMVARLHTMTCYAYLYYFLLVPLNFYVNETVWWLLTPEHSLRIIRFASQFF